MMESTTASVNVGRKYNTAKSSYSSEVNRFSSTMPDAEGEYRSSHSLHIFIRGRYCLQHTKKSGLTLFLKCAQFVSH